MHKTCFKCKITKPLDCFYAHPRMRDGHLNKCKECAKFDIRRHRRVSDVPRLYDQWRHATDGLRRAQSAAYAYAAGKADPAKKKARAVAYAALKRRQLVKQPCEACGTTIGVEMHHDDYAAPLDVHWVCSPCHKREHHPFVDVRPKRPF